MSGIRQLNSGDGAEPVSGEAKSSAEVGRLSPNRRRLLRRSLGSVPILMTLATRPAFGAMQCVTPSGFVSMPTSQHGTPTYCSGRTPGYWKQSQFFSSWLPPYYPTTVTGSSGHHATLFKDWFMVPPASPPVGSTWATVTFLDVLRTESYTASSSGGPYYDIARYVVASLLNIAQGWVPVLTTSLVRDMWTEYVTKGYFEPTAGVKWYHDDLSGYLQSTMPS